MKLQNTAVGLLTCMAALAGASASPSPRPIMGTQLLVQGGGHLRVSGTRNPLQPRSAADAKLGSTLADLSQHFTLARPGHALEDLHAMNPAARFIQRPTDAQPLVMVDAVTRGDPNALKAALIRLGLQHPAVFLNDVGGWLPVSRIPAAAALAELHSMRASMSRTRAGSATSQGDFVQRSDVLRTTYPTLTGSGVTVGVLSDSFDCYSVYRSNGLTPSGAAGYASNGFLADASVDMSTGDLPNVDVVQEAPCMSYGGPAQLPFTDEGRAMLQVIHDVAPGARLAFNTAESTEAEFASGILALASAGAKVIADDVGYFDEPFFQDGLVAQAIDTVEAQGVAYFSAAGNDGTNSFETSTVPDFSAVSSSAPNSGEHLLNFNAGGTGTASTNLPVTIPALAPGQFIAIVLEWDQPYVTGAPGSPGATSQLDLCITGASGTDTITDMNGNLASCTGKNALGVDPVQVIIISNPGDGTSNQPSTSTQNLNIEVGLAAGNTPGLVKVVIEDGGAGATINQYSTNSSTLQGHPGAAGAAAVGAAFYFQTPLCGTSPAMLETYSAEGGAPILFDTSGNRLSTPVTRQKPNFIGPDGVNDTFLGFTLASAGISLPQSGPAQCANDASFPNFFGTSAATPHAAGIAALMLQANSAATPTQIFGALQSSALSMGGTTPNFSTGYGFIQADAALALLSPGKPALSLSPSSVTVGGSATLTWSSINTSSCTASGSWSGTQKTSGSQSITAPATAGTATYTLTCANPVGTAASSAQLTVNAASSGGGGSSGGGSTGSGGSTGGTGGSTGGTGGGSTSSGGSGGGGALDGLTLLILASLGLASLSRRGGARPRRITPARIGASE